MLEKNIESECLEGALMGVLVRKLADRRAVTAVEYAIIVGVMVAALVIGVPAIGKNLTNIFTSVAAPL
jgi:Flp pilus assembly pilin Flp